MASAVFAPYEAAAVVKILESDSSITSYLEQEQVILFHRKILSDSDPDLKNKIIGGLSIEHVYTLFFDKITIIMIVFQYMEITACEVAYVLAS